MDPNQSDIAKQWNTVFVDNANLMKAGLYNSTSSYQYIYDSPVPADISGNGVPNDASLPPSVSNSTPSDEDSRITLTVNSTYVSYDSSTGEDLGVNNGIYYLNVSDFIRFSNPNIFLSGSTEIQVSKTETATIPSTNNTFTIINAAYVAKYTIKEVVESVIDFYYIDIITELTSITGTPPSGPGYPVDNDTKFYTNHIDSPTVFFQNSSNIATPTIGFYRMTRGNLTDSPANTIGDGSVYTIDDVDKYYIMRIQPSDSNYIYTNPANLNLQWGSSDTSVDVVSTVKCYKDKCTMIVNIPSPPDNFSCKFINSSGTELNNLVISSNCLFVPIFNPPTKSLQEIRYTDLISSTNDNLSDKRYYIPTMIPGGDYLNIYRDNKLSVVFMSGSEPKMTADRCRQPWRLSHYVRSNETSKDDEVLKVAYNTAAALVYNASLDTITPGRLTLNVNINNLTNGYDGYSGDMVPPLLSLIDALQYKNYTDLEPAIIQYSSDIKALSTTLTLEQLIAKLTNGQDSDKVYPVLDSRTSGGQQLGLSGCGFICTFDFLSRSNFNVMLKYDAIN
jgi:hypothetical protein